MKTFSRPPFPHPAILLTAAPLLIGPAASCSAQNPGTPAPPTTHAVHAGEVVIEPAPNAPLPPFAFRPDDEALLDKIQRASFGYFWNQCHPETKLVHDRSGSDVVSVAGVGFGLSALPVAVERGWITKDQGRERAVTVLSALLDEPTNRKAGLFYHFIYDDSAKPRRIGTELVVSTIDSAILFAGAAVAGQYFGGQVNALADRMLSDADWSFFADPDGDPPYAQGFLSLGWRPAADEDPTGAGSLLPYGWLDSGDEHRLTTFLAVSAPTPEHRIPPETYFRLRRQIGWHEPAGEVVWFPYSGALFTAFFAHCWIDPIALGTDNPAEWGIEHRARVDWWENSRRLVHLHRDRAIANPQGLPTLGPDAWGLTACDGPDGYLVPGFFPEPVRMIGARPGFDFSTFQPAERWGDGVVPPYGAGSSIVFEPALALSAMRHYLSLTKPDGEPLAWRDPEQGGYGFVDAFRAGDDPWVAEDSVAIDHGPMLLLIENARTGLVWDLFMDHPMVRAGLGRLRLGGSDAIPAEERGKSTFPG